MELGYNSGVGIFNVARKKIVTLDYIDNKNVENHNENEGGDEKLCMRKVGIGLAQHEHERNATTRDRTDKLKWEYFPVE